MNQGDTVELGAGQRILYDVEANAARYEADEATITGPAHVLAFELADGPAGQALLSAPVELDSGEARLLRCDRVDFPPGGVAYLHTHQGPGIRVLLHGTIRIETGGQSRDYGPLEAWFEPGPEPVFAAASDTEPTAFVRCMVLPAQLQGKSSIRYVRDEDADKPQGPELHRVRRRAAVRTGGQLLADQLVVHGCELAFCVPGESYLPLLDGLFSHRDAVRLVTCRHEAAAANAAEATGKLLGRPGVCMVTRGPGATHAAIGVHTARQDSTPMILLVGQVARGHRGREAFQEIDFERMFGPVAKAAIEIDDADRIPEVVARAFTEATSGRPGPVVVSVPEDILAAGSEAPDAQPYTAREPAAAPQDVAALRELLEAAERPFVLAGGGLWDARACTHLADWAQACGLPVGVTFRRQDIVDNELQCYAGDVGLGINPRLARRIAEADLLIALGPRLTEVETQGYTLPVPPVPRQTLVHVHPDAKELGRVYQPRLGVLSGVRSFATAVDSVGRVSGERWADWAAEARSDYEAWSNPEPRASDGVDLRAVIRHLRDDLPEDAIVCSGAGNYTVWLHRFFRYRRFGTQLAPQSGAMGYGVPAALAAALLHPECPVIAFSGDGDFQMCGQELATMVQEQLPIVVLVANNGMYGTIRMHQERRFPERVIATDLVNPDFAALARSYGAHGERVEHTDDFPDALTRARASGGPALIELVTDREALTPAASLTETRAKAKAAD